MIRITSVLKLLIALFAAPAFAASTIITTATNNLPATYAVTWPSLAVTSTSMQRNVYVYNGCAVPIAINMTSSNGLAPSSSACVGTATASCAEYFIPATTGQAFLNAFSARYVFARTTGGSACSSGTVIVQTW